MKKIFAIVLGASMLFASCQKFVEGYDVSPNSPSDASPDLLLAASELSVFATYGGNMSRIASMWSQQSEGTSNQSEAVGKYILDEGDVENEWDVIYTRGLKNLRLIQSKAGNESPHYTGVAQVLEALMIGVATDFWGDVPYSQAMGGLNTDQTFEAACDNQEDILAAMQTLLDDAIANCSAADSKLSPGYDDYIYEGDMAKWVGFANLLKARYHMRASGRDAGWATKALADVAAAKAAGFADASGDANCIFGTNANEFNQWYAFAKVARQNYMKAGANLVDMMNAQSDPRLPYYFTEGDTGGYYGAGLGSLDVTASDFGSYFASASSVTPLGTFVELSFIEAEAKLASGDKSGAADAHNAAIAAHVEQITGMAADPAWITANASEDANSITLEKIMTQKYISGFTMMEPYNDWRRTGIPALSAHPSGNLGSDMALRFPTSLGERLYNTKYGTTYGIQELNMPVWWDN